MSAVADSYHKGDWQGSRVFNVWLLAFTAIGKWACRSKVSACRYSERECLQPLRDFGRCGFVATGQSLRRSPWQIWSERHPCRAGVSIPSQMRMHVFDLRSALFTNRQIDKLPSPSGFAGRAVRCAATPIAYYSNGWETGHAKAALAFISVSQSSGGFPLSSIPLKTT